jgi:heptosyltransferase-2
MAQKVLVVGPSWVGDMVMAQSLFKLLKQKKRAKTIHVLATPWTLSLLERMPEVDKAIPLPIGHGELKLTKRAEIAKGLRAFGYDQAIVLPNSFKSALVPYFAKIKRRTGWLGESRFFLLNDIRRLDKDRYPLMIDQFMALGIEKTENLIRSECFYPSFQLSKNALLQILDKHKGLLKGRPVLAIAPGAAFGPAKRWPKTYYADIANHQLKAGWDVWLFGSEQDKEASLQIMSLTNNRCENFVGRLALSETIDLLTLVDGIITNDSGLLHVASALDKPVVAIYGSTDPSFTPPLSNKATVLKLQLECQPCFKRECPFGHYRCLYDLRPAVVLNAISAWKI